MVPGGYKRYTDFTYVQGAADDEESWSHGLNSIQFWAHAERLLDCSDDNQVLEIIRQIVRTQPVEQSISDISPIESTGLSLGIGFSSGDCPVIICGKEGESTNNVLHLNFPPKIKPVVALTQRIFPDAVTFALKHGILRNSLLIILAANASRFALDLSVGATLVLLSLFFNDSGIFSSQIRLIVGMTEDRRGKVITKEHIRTRLVWIISARGYQIERVSRQTLKAVNTYMMSKDTNQTMQIM